MQTSPKKTRRKKIISKSPNRLKKKIGKNKDQNEHQDELEKMEQEQKRKKLCMTQKLENRNGLLKSNSGESPISKIACH